MRRPWLALVVLVLLGISATLFVNAGARVSLPDDTFALALELELDEPPGEALLQLGLQPVRAAVDVTEVSLAPVVIDSSAVLSIAPKTSPPRC